MPHDPLFMAIAVEAVLRAGEMQMARFGTQMEIGKKGAIDLVTPVDLEVEMMFRQMIAARLPTHDVLAEELQTDAEMSRTPARHRWVFDPIDGTVNYAHGLPIFCASLALEVDGQPEVGAVYDPNRKELFTAEKGVGAWLNGAPLRVSMASTLLDSVLCTGFPYDVHETLDEVVGLFAKFVGRARAVRRLGSAAVDLCYVAAGRLDGFWEQRLQAWDVSAGSLIVEEAGGRVTGLDATSFSSHSGQVLATNGRIHDEMVAAIAQFNVERSRNRTG